MQKGGKTWRRAERSGGGRDVARDATDGLRVGRIGPALAGVRRAVASRCVEERDVVLRERRRVPDKRVVGASGAVVMRPRRPPHEVLYPLGEGP